MRCILHDHDNAGQPVPTFPLKPHLQIETSPGKFHSYWVVDGLTVELYPKLMQRLIDDHGHDPNVKDLARVLRLAGTYHLKDPDRPFRVRIVHASGARPHTLDEFLAKFPAKEPGEASRPGAPNVVAHPQLDQGWVAMTKALAARAAQITHCGANLGERRVPREHLEMALREFAELMRNTDASGKPSGLNWANEWRGINEGYDKGLPHEPYRPQRASGPRAMPTDQAQRLKALRDWEKSWADRIVAACAGKGQPGFDLGDELLLRIEPALRAGPATARPAI